MESSLLEPIYLQGTGEFGQIVPLFFFLKSAALVKYAEVK